VWRYALPGIAVVGAFVALLGALVHVPRPVPVYPAVVPAASSPPVAPAREGTRAGADIPTTAPEPPPPPPPAAGSAAQAAPEPAARPNPPPAQIADLPVLDLKAPGADDTAPPAQARAQAKAHETPVPEKVAAPQPAPVAPPAAKPEEQFASVQGLVARMRREMDRQAVHPPTQPKSPTLPMQYWLTTAQRDLFVGDTAGARRVIESLRTVLAFQPVTPDDPVPRPGGEAALEALGLALAALNSGQIELATRHLDAARAALDTGAAANPSAPYAGPATPYSAPNAPYSGATGPYAGATTAYPTETAPYAGQTEPYVAAPAPYAYPATPYPR
jgi:hypothetical protein